MNNKLVPTRIMKHAEEMTGRPTHRRMACSLAAFLPLQRDHPFGIRRRLDVRTSKRAEARDPGVPPPFPTAWFRFVKRTALLLLLSTLNAQLSTAHAQGTAFTYQGRLNNNANPASGAYDLKFTLFNTNVTGVAYAGPVTNSAIAVSNGLFTTVIDFGTGVFTGGSNWLEIAVRPNGNGTFNTLTPRQQLTPAPYAITAGNLAAVAQFNTVGIGNYATVGGGFSNNASGYAATVAGGGYENMAISGYTTVSGGGRNTASSSGATVAGGTDNTASGNYATVAGGTDNTASGFYSFAAGSYAQATHNHSFVWSDLGSGTFSSTADNEFSARASGGIRLAGDVAIEGGASSYHHLSLNGGNSTGFLFGSYPYFGDGVHLGYNFYADSAGAPHVIASGGGTSRITAGYGEIVLAVGAVNTAPNAIRLDATTAGVTVYGTFNNLSDRNAKQDFAPVSSSAILNAVLQLPVSEWSYKEDPKTRHVGPVAQDFHSAFNIGTDDKHIAPIDEGGVALAAIQGLNRKVEVRSEKSDDRFQRLEAENAELKRELSEIKALLTKISQKDN